MSEGLTFFLSEVRRFFVTYSGGVLPLRCSGPGHSEGASKHVPCCSGDNVTKNTKLIERAAVRRCFFPCGPSKPFFRA